MTPRMRTIQEAAAELKRIDPNTAITPYFIRCMVLDGTIPHVKAGTKRLLNLDILLSYLNMEKPTECQQNELQPKNLEHFGEIRPIREE